ncbi:raffinose/stachyose/melibiose transport system substrate-binding protein [Fontibacillus solani]|uniref:Raffinose/stachyose/melibiose transport system substrate-binding protein n=1 Tax=Fontibacillus solani TaxID=1572857 RepID=A0A7W3SVP1_9BACL|nr:extracellular solute-binding protein [Fontibacillus solani]MBA9087105.1 raffinose/stachyose/melibiose transport system substrate-binding protein [Fontibacillus solani]
MRAKKRIWASALALLLAVSLSACGGGNTPATGNNAGTTGEANSGTSGNAGEKVKLRVYAQHFDDDTSKPFDYAVQELAKEMPNVEIELDPAVQDGNQKLKTYAATGNLPDIFFTDWKTLQTFAKSKNVLLLDDYEAAKEYKANLNPGVESKIIAPDGHIYAFPDTGIEFQLLYYNKQIFQDAGISVPIKTIDELADAAKKLKAAGYVPLSIFAKEKWISTALYNALITREDGIGTAVFEKDAPAETPQAAITAAKHMKQLQEAGLFDVNATNTNYDQASSLFYTGKAAMFINGQWEIYSSQEKMGDNVDFMYWPAKDEATYEKMKLQLAGSGSPQGYAVSPQSKNIDLAVKVAAILAKKSAEYKYTQLGNPIVSPKIDKPVEATDVPAMMQRLASEVLPNAQGYAQAVNSTEISNTIDDNAQNLLVNGYTVDDFINNMNRALKK